MKKQTILIYFTILIFNIYNIVGMFQDIAPTLKEKNIYQLTHTYSLEELKTFRLLAQEAQTQAQAQSSLLKKLNKAIRLIEKQNQELEKLKQEKKEIEIKSHFRTHSSGTISVKKRFKIKNEDKLKEKLISGLKSGKKTVTHNGYNFYIGAHEELIDPIDNKIVPAMLHTKKNNITYTDFGAGELKSASFRILIKFLLNGGTIKNIHVIDTDYQKIIDGLHNQNLMELNTRMQMQRIINIITILLSISKNKINFYIHSNAYAYIDFLQKKNMEKADIITGFYIPNVGTSGFIKSILCWEHIHKQGDKEIFTEPFLDLCYTLFNGTKEKILFIQGTEKGLSIAKENFKKIFKTEYNKRIEDLYTTLKEPKKSLMQKIHQKIHQKN